MIVVIKQMLFLIKVANYHHLIHVNIVIIINKIVFMDIVYHHHLLQVQQQNENQVMIQIVAIQNDGKYLIKHISIVLKKQIFFSSKTKTSSQEKTSLPNTNRFTSPITAFRRKKKTPSHTNDPGKIYLSFYNII